MNKLKALLTDYKERKKKKEKKRKEKKEKKKKRKKEQKKKKKKKRKEKKKKKRKEKEKKLYFFFTKLKKDVLNRKLTCSTITLKFNISNQPINTEGLHPLVNYSLERCHHVVLSKVLKMMPVQRVFT